MNMIIHDDGHTNVVAADGLLAPAELSKRNPEFKAGSMDFIITNPPFGSSIKQAEKAYFHQYRLANKSADWLNPKSKAAVRPAQDTEILFMEQCHTYLKEGGYLAIVIPDGILTNSSLQYVRDQIETDYRIVAVVSMPQSAFAPTGAAVKSSVLFLRKHSAAQSQAISNLRQRLQDEVKKRHDFDKKFKTIEDGKKIALKRQIDFAGTEVARRAALQLASMQEAAPDKKLGIEDTPAFAQWKKQVSDEYAEKLDALKQTVADDYAEQLKTQRLDYDIFMAIANEIGYDATGKDTKTNELDPIAQALREFIADIEAGRA